VAMTAAVVADNLVAPTRPSSRCRSSGMWARAQSVERVDHAVLRTGIEAKEARGAQGRRFRYSHRRCHQGVEAEYYAPYVNHATMEPQTATALFKDGKVEVCGHAEWRLRRRSLEASGVCWKAPMCTRCTQAADLGGGPASGIHK
jgi:hypothetical protein